jgi:hypothetical protein
VIHFHFPMRLHIQPGIKTPVCFAWLLSMRC